jgi:hypothetical protein
MCAFGHTCHALHHLRRYAQTHYYCAPVTHLTLCVRTQREPCWLGMMAHGECVAPQQSMRPQLRCRCSPTWCCWALYLTLDHWRGYRERLVTSLCYQMWTRALQFLSLLHWMALLPAVIHLIEPRHLLFAESPLMHQRQLQGAKRLRK